MKITILGSGTSCGVPSIGCDCRVCQSADPHDRRLRTSAMVEVDGVRILIDCGPDFREQMLRVPFARIDAVLVTHEHYDHVGGIDDLRPFCRFGQVDVYAEEYAAERLRQRIPYCFFENLYPGVPRIALNNIEVNVPFMVKGVEIMPIRVMHGKLPILGYRIGKLAYITDLKTLPEDQMEKLLGLECLIINALRFKEHHSHQSISEALELVGRIAPKKTYFIHMSHDAGLHEETNRLLPENVCLAYDSMQIEC